jgi:hypothetical protein
LLVDLRNAVRRVKSDVAEEIQASIVLQRMYEKQLREKEK